MIELALTSFATLFVIIDPIGLTPLFIALTNGQTQRQRMSIALRACLIASALLMLFGIAGEELLGVIGIGMPAFRISGGVLLFLTAIDMLFEKRTERREQQADEAVTSHNDPSVFPLAVPLLAGPGALTTMILLTGSHNGNIYEQVVVHAVMLIVILCAFCFFYIAGRISGYLGKTGILVITRVLGMLLAALAIQFIIDGIRDLGIL